MTENTSDMNKRKGEGGGGGRGESGNNTMKFLLWDISIQETRPFKGHKTGPGKMFI